MNIIIRPILKILSLPLFFVFLGLISFIINGVILWLFNNIFKNVLMID
ncbi:MAG: phage holin family protein [Candidatus Peribacteria bacterium]|nr:phage holin family protein [Candidatus Peribacteria bacterium]